MERPLNIIIRSKLHLSLGTDVRLNGNGNDAKTTYRQPAQNGVLTDLVCRDIILFSLINPVQARQIEINIIYSPIIGQ